MIDDSRCIGGVDGGFYCEGILMWIHALSRGSTRLLEKLYERQFFWTDSQQTKTLHFHRNWIRGQIDRARGTRVFQFDVFFLFFSHVLVSRKECHIGGGEGFYCEGILMWIFFFFVFFFVFVLENHWLRLAFCRYWFWYKEFHTLRRPNRVCLELNRNLILLTRS